MVRLAWLAVLLAVPGAARGEGTEALFGHLKDRVAQVRVIELSTGTRSALGSGFFVSADAHLITNFHVVAQVANRPQQYRVELVRDGKDPLPMRVVGIDVVSDLAVLKGEESPQEFFTLTDPAIEKGRRLFSLGNPRDLGLAIVEGTYNGLIAESLYEHLHFSGALNPGMSGGPTVTADGEVVGVNVATEGNSVGFLVPIVRARELFAQVLARGKADPDLTAQAREQLLKNQQTMTDTLLKAAAVEAVELDGHKLPGRWAPFLRCWGNNDPPTHRLPYSTTSYYCNSRDALFLSREHETGIVRYQHLLTQSDVLNTFRYWSRQATIFEPSSGTDDESFDALEAGEADVTRYRCRQDFVAHGPLVSRVVLCARALKRFPGLYDVHLRLVTLTGAKRAVQSRLMLSGFSLENGLAVARRYLESVTWP